VQDEKDDRDHHDQVNEAAGDVKHKEPAQPGNQQNDGKYEQHRTSSDASLCIMYTRFAGVVG
jgi:hypothetical protein